LRDLASRKVAGKAHRRAWGTPCRNDCGMVKPVLHIGKLLLAFLLIPLQSPLASVVTAIVPRIDAVFGIVKMRLGLFEGSKLRAKLKSHNCLFTLDANEIHDAYELHGS
jgi:hypothetical protein